MIKNSKLDRKSIVIFLILVSIIAISAIFYTLSFSNKKTSLPSYAVSNLSSQQPSPTPEPWDYSLLIKVAEKTQYELNNNDDYPAWKKWDWESGIALVGLLHAYETLAKSTVNEHKNKAATILNSVENWMDREISEGTPFNNNSQYRDPDCDSIDWSDYENKKFRHPNHVAVSWALMMLYEYRPKTEYFEILNNTAEFLEKKACSHYIGNKKTTLHTKDGLWVDTLAMTAPFLAGYGKHFKQPKYINLATDEILIHSDYLVDHSIFGPVSAWHHGYDLKLNSADHPERAIWGRGNAWAALSVWKVYEALSNSSNNKEKIKNILSTQLVELNKVVVKNTEENNQDCENSLWHTVNNDKYLNNPENYCETSGSSGITAVMLYTKKIFPQLNLKEQESLKAVCGQVDNDGNVKNVSTGTGFFYINNGNTEPIPIPTYFAIPKKDVKPYGQGLFLIMASIEGCQ